MSGRTHQLQLAQAEANQRSRELSILEEEHGALASAAGQACDALEVAAGDPPSLVARVSGIAARARAIAGEVMLYGVHQTFGLARGHYTNFQASIVAEGYPSAYTDQQVNDMLEEVCPGAKVLASRLEEDYFADVAEE